MIINLKPFTVCLLELDQVRSNKRIYTKDSFKKLPSETFGYIGSIDTFAMHVDVAAFIAKNIRIEDNRLMAEIKILDTPFGDILKQFYKDLVYRPMGYARFNPREEGVVHVDDYQLIGANAFTKEQAA